MGRTFQETIDHVHGIEDYNSHNGIKILELDDKHCLGRVDITKNSLNTYGIVHGGLMFSASDLMGGVMACGTERTCVTSTSNINFLRSGKTEYITILAKPKKIGARLAIIDVSVYDDRERELSNGSFTYFITGKREFE